MKEFFESLEAVFAWAREQGAQYHTEGNPITFYRPAPAFPGEWGSCVAFPTEKNGRKGWGVSYWILSYQGMQKDVVRI